MSNDEDNRITSEARAYKTKSMVEKSSQRESDSDEEEESTNKTVDYSQYQMIFNKSQASNIETNSPLNMSNDEDNRITSEARAYKTKSMVEESSQRTQLFGETSEGGKNRSVGLDGILEKQRGNAISGSSYMYTEIDHWESKSAMSDGYDATGNHEVSRSSSILPQTHDWAKGTQAKRSLPPSSNFDSEFLLGGESEKKGMGKENVDLLKIKDGSMCDASAISLEVRNESLIVDDDYSEDFIDEGDDRPNFSENVGVGENMPLIASFEANLPSFDKKSCLPPTATAEQYIPELEDDYSQNFDEDCEGTLQDLKHTNISREEEQEDDNISCDTGETAVDTRCRKNMDLSFEDNKDDGACCIDETNEIRRSSSPLYESKVHSNGSYCDAERQESEEVCVYTQTLSNHSPLDLQALEESTDSIRSNLAIVRKEEEEPTPQTSAENFSPRTMNACDISFATETASESFSATGFSPYLLKGRAANSKT
uniref:Uncharacterized protein n=1 Tax=Leptocylindrus danicus TaxID=163516 RepID=A0A7S2K0G5_9STRA